MPVRTKLKDIREARGDTRMDLVRDLEVSYQVVQKWENDVLHQLDTNILHKLMTRYDVRYEDLIYEVDE